MPVMIRMAQPNLGDLERQAVMEVMESGVIAQGPRTAAFEKAFAQYCGAPHAAAVSSGTTALHLALLAHGIGPGDEVITSPFTFMATVSAILAVGARPVFADIEPDTYCLDPARVAELIGPKTKAIIAVHLYGHPADMAALVPLAESHGVVLIEDAAQAHGAEFKGQRVGSFGTGCFSFYPTKNMTTGEGGMVTTADPAIAELVQVLRNHGMRRRYYHDMVGYNFRMTDIGAAIGLVQLERLEGFNAARIANAQRMTALLGEGVACPVVRPDCRHVFHQYTVRVRNRDKVQQALSEAGVDSAVFYPVPVHHQKPLVERGLDKAHCPQAEKAAAEVLALPVHPRLSAEDVETVCRVVNKVIRGG
jgi:dTDP-4-amino-4,6-dideoxygalactose transaminase